MKSIWTWAASKPPKGFAPDRGLVHRAGLIRCQRRFEARGYRTQIQPRWLYRMSGFHLNAPAEMRRTAGTSLAFVKQPKPTAESDEVHSWHSLFIKIP